MDEQYELPDEWAWATVADVILDAQSGFSSGAKDVVGGVNQLRMNNIGADCRLSLDLVRTVPPELVKSKYLLQTNDLLVCHTNSVKLVGKVALFDRQDAPYVFSNHLTRLRVGADVIDPRWLWHVLATLWRDRYFETRCKQWVNQATIERETLLAAPVPLPSLAEQKRIVSRLDVLLAQSQTARAALDQLPAHLETYRQALLAAAFRGALHTADSGDEPASAILGQIRAERNRTWAATLRAQGKMAELLIDEDPAERHPSTERALPAGWRLTTVKEVAEVVGGIQKTPARAPRQNAFPYLRVANVQRGGLDLDIMLEFELGPGELEKWKLEPGDVLIVEGNGSLTEIGRCALWEGQIENCVHQNHIIRVRFPQGIEPAYFQYYLNSPVGQEAIRSVASSTSGLYTLSVSKVQRLLFPLAPLLEQRRIVARLGALLDQAAAIENSATAARRRLDELDQLILWRAFRGYLFVESVISAPAMAVADGDSAESPDSALGHTEDRGQIDIVNRTRPLSEPAKITLLLRMLQTTVRERVSAEDLWLESRLSLDEFFETLKQQVSAGWISEKRGELESYLETVL